MERHAGGRGHCAGRADTGGTGTPVVYLNGSYTGQRHWRPVINDLGPGWRHITYDERARGKSKRSADYSFEATWPG